MCRPARAGGAGGAAFRRGVPAWLAGGGAGQPRAVGVACPVSALGGARVGRAAGPARSSGHEACLEALRQLAVARQVRREPLLRLDRVTVGVLGRLAAAAAAGPARRSRRVRPRPGAARAGAGHVAATRAAQVRLAQPWPIRGARTRAARRSRQSRPPAAGPAGRWRPPAAGSSAGASTSTVLQHQLRPRQRCAAWRAAPAHGASRAPQPAAWRNRASAQTAAWREDGRYFGSISQGVNLPLPNPSLNAKGVCRLVCTCSPRTRRGGRGQLGRLYAYESNP